MSKFKALCSVAALVGLLGGIGCANNPGPSAGRMNAPRYQVAKTLPIAGDGRWDFIAFDPEAKLLYVPRQTHTQIIDPADGKLVADLPKTDGVHGVAIVQSVGRVFTSNGKSDNVSVFDLKSHALIGNVPAGKGPDAILYDSFSKKILCCNAKGNDITVIDPAAVPENAVVATIPVSSNPECPVSDGKGKVFLNLEDGNAVTVIDTAKMKVTATWPIEGGEGPTGIALDAEHHVLYCGCHNKVVGILDSETGKTLATLPIGEGVDGAEFDDVLQEAFISSGDGTVTAVRRTPAGNFEVVQTIRTRAGARTITIDHATHVLYLPTAEFLPKAEGEKRPQMKPGTFMIVVVSPTAG